MKSLSTLGFLALLALALPACNTADNDGLEPMSDSMSTRMLKPDMTKRSGFESDMTASRSGMGSYLQKQGFKTSDYNGTNAFRKGKTLDQTPFNQAKPNTHFGDKAFNNRDGTVRDASRDYPTESARDGTQTARQQDQSYRDSSTTFATSSQRDAAKAIERNQGPMIIEERQEDFRKATDYSEDDIRRMLNRR